MSKRVHMIVKSHHDALKLLSQTKASNYGIIIKNTPGLAKALKILCRYILNDTIKLQDKHVKRLKPHRKFIRRISASSHKAIKTKVQKGGSILRTILNVVLPLLPALL
jgi:hypothetical protein